MNTQANAVQESSVQSQAIAVIPASRRMYWSVRRELWENRSIYMAPLAVAALFLAGFFISTGHLPIQVRAAAALNAAQQQELFEQPYNFAALLLMAKQASRTAVPCTARRLAKGTRCACGLTMQQVCTARAA